MLKRFSSVALAALIPLTAAAGMIGSDLFLISVGRGPGANESYWYTTVWIHNPGTANARVTVSLLRRGQPNTAPEQQILTVSPGETLKIGDVLWDLYGEQEASGALRFAADRRIVVSSRIYNLPGSDPAESQGQFMAGMPAELAVGLGDATDIPGITQPADDSFRCNFAMVETSGNQAEVEVMLVDGDGVTLASRSYALQPFEPAQRNLSHLGGGAIVDGGRLNVAVTGGSGRVLALASMVGNGIVSQDPSTLEMEIEIPEGSSSGDITAVFAGEGLAGGGGSGDVTLGIDTAGASAGQALVYDGAHVGWDSPPGGLTLPFAGSQATTGAAFKVTNTSATGNVFGVRGENQSTAGAGVYGWSSAGSGTTGGVVGQASSTDGVGVFGVADSGSGLAIGVMGTTVSNEGAGVVAFGAGDGADLIAGSVTASDSGIISSDPRFSSSSLELRSYDSAVVLLDADEDESGEQFVVAAGNGTTLFNVSQTGDLSQPATADGLVKAAAYVWCGEDAHLVRGFNTVTQIVIVREHLPGSCYIDFDFDVSERFFSASSHPATGPGGLRHVNCEPRFGADDEVLCHVDTDDHTSIDGPVYLVVY